MNEAYPSGNSRSGGTPCRLPSSSTGRRSARPRQTNRTRCSVARERPGTGIALALGHDVSSQALSAWRDHATRAHGAVADATTGRYDGLFVARGDAMPVGTVARLVADFHAPEPVTLVVTDGEAAVRSTDGTDVATAMATATDTVGGESVGTNDRARARFDVSTAKFIEAFREAV